MTGKLYHKWSTILLPKKENKKKKTTQNNVVPVADDMPELMEKKSHEAPSLEKEIQKIKASERRRVSLLQERLPL